MNRLTCLHLVILMLTCPCARGDDGPTVLSAASFGAAGGLQFCQFGQIIVSILHPSTGKIFLPPRLAFASLFRSPSIYTFEPGRMIPLLWLFLASMLSFLSPAV